MKQFKFLTFMLAMIAGVAFFVSCSDDDDDSGSGSCSAKINGKSYSLAYGWYFEQDKALSLEFSDVKNPNNLNPSVTNIQWLTFNLDGGMESGVIVTGTYNGEMEFWEYKSGNYSDFLCGDVKITISKNGSGYSISVPETTVELRNYETYKVLGTTKFSFSYNGILQPSQIE